ncbi:MAG: DUF2490 domain-containing protein [Saprospiraceae bacterium]|nr:DUF2490 domain-containing protein [Saprospiraceae bacterium]MDW8484729.1 DUF2490 domain-containing protein [Saprospiraceae bacterium]
MNEVFSAEEQRCTVEDLMESDLAHTRVSEVNHTFGPLCLGNPPMLSRIIAILAAVIFIKIVPNADAQSVQHQAVNWFTYFAHYRLSRHWGMHLDIQFRMDAQAQRANQTLLRPGLQYLLSPNTNLTLGYALIGNSSPNGYFSEHRLWQQYLHTARWGSGHSMTHRLRLEERWAAYSDGRRGWREGLRFRYFNRTIFNLSKNPSRHVKPYFALQNEVFINTAARQLNPNFFDQNRLLLAIGVLHNGHTRLELGYMNQYINPIGNVDIINHVLHFSILQVLDFYPSE